ncbi:ABC transporter ATP-binding protein [Desulfosarcina alkanivorans]|uniref:ABC transporter ATP-binding protein n=1 Tax=Desulfosarcina alkanivorans TaxID=571177 RepID=A0A5K7YTD2_9BACT|nr:ABC transporter ATP-binding protein [Desulfosarcina alkanivorans]BBO71665.1 ABC transporter ATP-binding protein [Desulfosarcina alkanivorans]
MLKVNNLNVSYGYLQVVWNVSLEVGEGEMVAILGPNGAGKTTTLKSITGLLAPMDGSVQFLGQDITGTPTHQLPHLGLAFIPEERNLFSAMSVEDNLLMGAFTIKDKAQIKKNLRYVYDLFPRLEERDVQLAGTMSGGERQMLAIARGLMSNPKLIILDEPSMGLSPENVVAVFETIEKLREEKVTVVIVEQNVDTTLKFANRAYVMEQGRVAMEDTSENILSNDHVRKMYLGIGD